MKRIAQELVMIAKILVSAKPDVRIYYLGGGSYVVGLPPAKAKELQSAFPKSFRRGGKSNPDGTISYYVTEKASKLAKIWCEENGLSVGGSPMWDLEPGEMPSW